MTAQLCPWCEEPVDLRDPKAPLPTVITIPAWGQSVLIHALCGAKLLNAGMQAKPRRPKAAHPATGTGAAELMAYATGHPSTGTRHLTVVQEA